MTPTRRWRLVVAYDGSGFRGFAEQAGVDTVAGTLARAISRSVRLEEPPAIVCAGRTDAGVHATAQVAHVDLPEDYTGDLARAVNRQTSPTLVVRAAEPAPPGFDARRSATSRHYRYLVLNAPVPDPLLAPLAWHVPEPLDLRSMAAASDPLIGEHDFRAFCRRAPGTTPDDPIVRRVLGAGWRRLGSWPGEADGAPAGSWGAGSSGSWGAGSSAAGSSAAGSSAAAPAEGCWLGLLRFDIVAGSFCHQMVRSVVAALVEAGRGRASAATVMAMLAAGTRAGAPQPAPPHGLCLVGVGYEGGEGGAGRVADQAGGGVSGQAAGGGGLPGPVTSR